MITENDELKKPLMPDWISIPTGLSDFIANSLEIGRDLVAAKTVDEHEARYTARGNNGLYEVDVELRIKGEGKG